MILLHVCNIMNIQLIVFVNCLKTLMFYLKILKIKFPSQNSIQLVYFMTMDYYGSVFGNSPNEDIENFVNKYLTTYQYFFQNEIHVAQIHQHKQTCKKKH
jgi:hypothetical protein